MVAAQKVHVGELRKKERKERKKETLYVSIIVGAPIYSIYNMPYTAVHSRI